jgi:hypothetical protein
MGFEHPQLFIEFHCVWLNNLIFIEGIDHFFLNLGYRFFFRPLDSAARGSRNPPTFSYALVLVCPGLVKTTLRCWDLLAISLHNTDCTAGWKFFHVNQKHIWTACLLQHAVLSKKESWLMRSSCYVLRPCTNFCTNSAIFTKFGVLCRDADRSGRAV